ncbi:MAG: heavy metal translocating P-type ATPase [Woeseiaceae bacterium]|jgi:Cu2+-exporting ATPase|nr:heavy metal translocating P-type ATPase [Woeseiaceae bacterium]
MNDDTACFHCALPVIDQRYTVDIDGEPRAVCCPGCKAVAELIRDSGMSRYYALREAPEPGVGKPEEDAGEWEVFNRRDMLDAFAASDADRAEATIYVGGMYCAACSWLIETTLKGTAGVAEADVNPVTHRLRVVFDSTVIGLGTLLATLSQLGYYPQPLAPDSTAAPEVQEQRAALKRLLVASLGMMQVMMFAVALYAGEFQGISADMERFLRLVSFFVTTPVVFYSARPFFASAVRGIRTRHPGMDLPVSIAIGAAYTASVWSTFYDGPAVWFDSVTMFVFFLTVGRFLEMRARHRSIDRSVALSSILPNTVIRVDDAGETTVAANQLVAGDVIRIRAGEPIPADGELVDGTTSVDEALLSGESRPQAKAPGDTVFAGSVNLDQQVLVRVQSTGVDTTLGTIGRLSERARYARPAFVRLADRVASYIVVAILVIAAFVAAAWGYYMPERAFEVTLSVLVVTCPCALALATPAAFAAAGSRMAELRLLVTNGDAVESISRATHVAFDKTGTLTRGEPVIVETRPLAEDQSAADLLEIAAALESASTHPLARAFHAVDTPYRPEQVETHVGAGLTGSVNGKRYRLGSADFVPGAGRYAAELADDRPTIYLGDDDRPLAVFVVDDAPREDAAATLDTLRRMGLGISLMSGDREAAVSRLAGELGIGDYAAECTPQGKLDRLAARQQAGEVIIMVGDGINDAPVLAGADASIAPAHSALLAQTSADVIMLGDRLGPVVTAIELSRKTLRIVRQNLAWAILYNASALPLAIAGYVPPWLAAIGMSASSLIVVLNALRLSRAGNDSRVITA